MRSEYKRDVHNNYLVLESDTKVEESSYPVRMLLANALPVLLKCRLQRMDGKLLFYYDITSRQSMDAFYEKKKISYEDLRLIFGSFVELVEKMSEYLLSPDQLVLQPEFIFFDAEKKSMSFCYLPGYERSIQEQFQALTEYILPKLDHKDDSAVVLGYGIYRRALEDIFQLEHIKEEVFQVREEFQEKEKVKEPGLFQEPFLKPDDLELEHVSKEDFFLEQENQEKKKRKKKSKAGQIISILAGCITATVVLLLIILGEIMGYIPVLKVEVMAAITILTACLVALIGFLIPKEDLKEINPKETNKFTEKEIYEMHDWRTRENREEASDRKKVIKEESGKGSSFRIKGEWNQKEDYGETVILSEEPVRGPATLVSREPGELATIYLQEDLTVIGKMENAADVVVDLPTVSRLHAKIRKRGDEYFLSDLNSRNGTAVNGRMLKADEEYLLKEEDKVDFAQARYIFLK